MRGRGEGTNHKKNAAASWKRWDPQWEHEVGTVKTVEEVSQYREESGGGRQGGRIEETWGEGRREGER